MSSSSQRSLLNGSADRRTQNQAEIDKLNKQLKDSKYNARFHGDALIGDPLAATGFLANWGNTLADLRKIFAPSNLPSLGVGLGKLLTGKGLDIKAFAKIVGSLPNDSHLRAGIIEGQVKTKYERMLHPPLTYLGDAFQYRQADGKFNSVLHPHLGQAGAPYAKTVPSKTHPLGALPDPGDLFDRLMARDDKGRPSTSGLSSMLIYHATIIIHDIFRTNDKDKNISDSSSYLDLSPLYGYTEEMVRKVRDGKFKLGLLKPDTFAEDRLLRQPPGVCIMLVMYNRYHNYVATQLRRINENGKFSIPKKFIGKKLVAAAKFLKADQKAKDQESKEKLKNALAEYEKASDLYDKVEVPDDDEPENEKTKSIRKIVEDYNKAVETLRKVIKDLIEKAEKPKLPEKPEKPEDLDKFEQDYDNAWNKLDDDLFGTARLITCGMYIQVSIHDYLRALMGFHQFNTNFTLDPRLNMEKEKVSRGEGNQVTVEFNLLYRFHCAISKADEKYTEDFMKESIGDRVFQNPNWDPKTLTLSQYLDIIEYGKQFQQPKFQPEKQVFGLSKNADLCFTRNPITGLFDDQQMINQLLKSMDDPISNFGPKNIPRCLRPVEIMGIVQARKWEVGTLNDFREFFKMPRHKTFESITPKEDVQNALRDLYEHPDKVELYPGVFCESDKYMNADPGPSDLDSALWAAIFSDAITLVRSDRFYTIDWNTNSLTSWGMKEVTPDNDNLKSSVFHRLLQRAFPEWFPYDSIRFFHPFYTSKQNAIFAEQQGYGLDFRRNSEPAAPGSQGEHTATKYDTTAQKPTKPLYLDDYASIEALLNDPSDGIVHPARLERRNLPRKVAEVLEPGQKPRGEKIPNIEENTPAMMEYFVGLSREIITREFIKMNDTPTYQIDITRDFAIPVTVCHVADFLGFSHHIRTEARPNALYSENEIYQHITNCQIFLSYNVDETKLLRRRKAFRTSMKFLYDLTRRATVAEASNPLAHWNRATLRFLGRRPSNAMTELGLKVAKEIYRNERDSGKTAAILLLMALDNAYNSVLVFTSVLNLFVGDLYKDANGQKPEFPVLWSDIQNLAFDDSKDNLYEAILLEAQKKSVKLPVIRKVIKDLTIEVPKKEKIELKKGQKVIYDIWRAEQERKDADKKASEKSNLLLKCSFTAKFAHYHPDNVYSLALAAMIKVLAQMKNLRRGHDSQGHLKKVNIDASYEGYANFMAPQRMKKVAFDVEEARNGTDEKLKKAAESVFNKDILKPSTNTYLTPEWDEMIPFPTTWKVRFDGFGYSDYGGEGHPMLKDVPVRDDTSPFYQPQGASHIGGSFAQSICICAAQGVNCRCKDLAASGGASVDADASSSKVVTTSAGSQGCGALGQSVVNY